MNPIRKAIFDLVKPKMFDPMSGLDMDRIGWHKAGSSSTSTYDYYKSTDYENAYPSISKIANAFLTIEPYAINENGEPTEANVVDRLYSPNKQMSAAEFREALVVMNLVHKKVYIRVHTKTEGSKITADNIVGYSFLENVVEVVRDNKIKYQLQNAEVLDDSEVMVLKNLNPHALSEGFSPSQAARKWVNLDDYIAAYQAGFFENGAVPAGQFIVTAPSVTEFNDIVDKLIAQHKGAGKNNNVTYAHKPVDQTGKPMNANIEWVPFNSTNKDLALKEIFEQANQKIDSVYGVPAEIRGFLSNSNYASVATAELVFMKYVVSPIALKIWDKFNHELNRITGGTGIAVHYDLDLPQMADEEKIVAEKRAIDMATITAAMSAGFELKSLVEAMGYPEEYAKLKLRQVLPTTTAPPKEADKQDDEEVQTDDEVEETPDDKKGKSHIVASPEMASKRLTITERYDYEYRLGEVLNEMTGDMVAAAIEEVDESGKKAVKTKAIEPTEEEIERRAAQMLTVVMPMIVKEGQAQLEEALNMLLIAGINENPSTTFELTAAQRKSYATYVKKVGTSYGATTAEALRAIMVQGYEQGLSAGAIKSRLSDVMSQQWRIDRVTHTEINRMGAQANVDSMVNIAREVDVKIDKVWTHSGGSDSPCEFCVAMIGQSVPVTDAYLPVGQGVIGRDGGEYINDFVDVDAGSLHPNCHCLSTFKIRR